MPEIKQLEWANLKPDIPEKSIHIPKTKELPKGYKKYDQAFIRLPKKENPLQDQETKVHR